MNGITEQVRCWLFMMETHSCEIHGEQGHAVAQAVSAGFPLWQAGPDPRSDHVGFVVDNVALGQISSKNFGFSYQFSFH
jgi:Zn-dependent M28 family amino/carboxypeptidase